MMHILVTNMILFSGINQFSIGSYLHFDSHDCYRDFQKTKVEDVKVTPIMWQINNQCSLGTYNYQQIYS